MDSSSQNANGTVPNRTHLALVFTDVVGSSAAKRAAALGQDAGARDRAYLESVQAKHLGLIRRVLAEYNGKEIMTIGDSFFLTFEDPVDALRCSAAIQQRLYDQPINTPSGPMQLRIGIHVGTPEYFENSWHGTDVDTAARTEAAGSPGQIVVTEAARRAMGDPSVDITFHPLGTFVLKDIGKIRLWDADYGRHKRRRAAIPSVEQRRRKHIALNVILLLVFAGLAGGAAWRWRLDRVARILANAAKQSIIVTDFENKTGDPVFDHTLTEGFTAQLEQSPVLKLVSQQHLRESMKYLGKSPDDPLTPAVMREIGIREGVKAYLTGSIVPLGNDFLITVSAKDISTDDDLATEQARAHDKEHVLEELGKIATVMRRHLGESLASIQKLDTPFGEATTSSLAAFRAYALGDVEHLRGHELPAAGYYRQAVELDPNFAMPWARLGVIAFSGDQEQQALEYFRKAYQLSKNVSERERLYIAGHYYQNGLGDLPKTIATLKLATQTYPRDFDNYVNLGDAEDEYGEREETWIPFAEAVRLDPTNAHAQDNLMGAQLALDKLSDAEATEARMKSVGVDVGRTYHLRETLMLDFLKGDRPGALQTIARTKGRMDDFQMTASAALTQEFDGRYRDAHASWLRAQTEVAALGARDAQAMFLLYGLSGSALAENCDGAAGHLKAALALDKSDQTLKQAAFVAALCNQPAIALPMLEQLAKRHPSDTLINQVTIPQSRAALALAAQEPAMALQHLAGSNQFDLVSPGAYLRGLAYLQLHDGENAIAAFRAATRYRGSALLCCQNYPQAQLGLARAYAMAGDAPGARREYERFFALWKSADPELPQLLAAKKEFAGLP